MDELFSEMKEYVKLHSEKVALDRIAPAIEQGNSLIDRYLSLKADSLNTPDIVRKVAETLFLLEALRNRLLRESAQ
ncbi:MAG TPA: hypothetical protein VKA60_21015 [Blastocatellia bacterium]|nr:hypothetical protein [Blastocatellia bacterium]